MSIAIRSLKKNRSIEFNTRVTDAHFDENAKCWNIEAENGQHYRARFLITAVGCLSSANVPAIEGLEDFAGEQYHTGQWPHEGVELKGKRVGQIGTGSTGIQAAPVIAETAKHLTVFQRTANYSVPARNHGLSDEDRFTHKRNASATASLTRSNTNGHGWLINEQQALNTPAEDRENIYEKAWKTGGLSQNTYFQNHL